MAAGFPTKANFATGDVLSATNMNDLAGTVNLINPTAKGDLYVGSAANTYTKLAVGANGTTIVADNSTATGLKWATPSSGAMTLITRQTFSNVATTTTTFDSVFSSTYGSYYVVIESLYAGTGADDLHLQWRYAGPTTQAASYFGNDLMVESGTTTITNSAQSNTAQSVLTRYIGPSTNPGQGQFFAYNLSGVSAEPSLYANYAEGGRGSTSTASVQCLAGRIYTGFLLKSSSSNITGTVSVYGLVKA